MAKIDLNNIAHSYAPDVADPVFALQEFNLTWNDGGRYAILGPSGCGKTTMLNIMSGIVRPQDNHAEYYVRHCAPVAWPDTI